MEETSKLLFVNRHAPLVVTGFHGCTRAIAESILFDNCFLPSTKAHDWLGDGFYFWEYGPNRAREWAERLYVRRNDGSAPAVIEATIHLGNCLNLLDTEHMQKLMEAYREVEASYQMQGRSLPKNTAAGAHFLDQRIINLYCRQVEIITGNSFQTVRGCFPEGEPIYLGSKILSKTHVQIAVRDSACITDVSIL